VHRLDAGRAQRLPDAGAAEHQGAADAAALHVIGRDARGGEHLLVIDRQPDVAEFRGLLRRRVGTAIGEECERHVPLPERA
jgi:hypothetical protein